MLGRNVLYGCAFLFLSCLVVTFYCPETETNQLLVTQNGVMRGMKMIDRNGGNFYAFQSIPYAKPPLGDLRFKLAQTSDRWTGILDATKDIPACKQKENGTVFGVEDCLYLNVYTPELPIHNNYKLKSVMVYIHGGYFTEGSATINDLGPHFLITEGVVIVVINYRLGALGFLNLEDLSAGIVANLGLKDQLIALKWVHNNIADFGGDPKCVTIFGESAGGISVHYHMFSHESKGLFHRIIAQSGIASLSSMFGIKNNAVTIAKYLGIETCNLKQMVKELQRLPLDRLFEAQENLEWLPKVHEDWIGSPIIEGDTPGAFLREDPYQSIISGNYNAVPLLLGWTNREGIILEIEQASLGEPYRYNVTKEIPNGLSSAAGPEITRFYFGNKTDLDEITERHIDLWTDNWYRYYVYKTAREHAKHGTVFLYEFSADTEMNFFKKFYWRSAKRLGASHVDDLGYLFMSKYTPKCIYPGSIEDKMIRVMVRLWANFAKYGRPIVKDDALLNMRTWLPITNSNIHFMNISNDMEEGVLNYDDRLKFWNDLYDKYYFKK